MLERSHACDAPRSDGLNAGMVVLEYMASTPATIDD
jgi:hypothetical protein